MTFVQTAGGRPAFSFLKPASRWPYLVTRPFTIWTTIELTISADGSSTQRLVGSSPFPRHWLYDDRGKLVEKAALTRAEFWLRTVFGQHTPWGGQDAQPVTAPPETELERTLSEQIMRGGERPRVRAIRPGEYLFHQAEEGTSMAVILDATSRSGSTAGWWAISGRGPSSASGRRWKAAGAPQTCGP